MEKFMLIMREDLKKLRQCTNEERFAEVHEMFEWTKSLIQSLVIMFTQSLWQYQEAT